MKIEQGNLGIEHYSVYHLEKIVKGEIKGQFSPSEAQEELAQRGIEKWIKIKFGLNKKSTMCKS